MENWMLLTSLVVLPIFAGALSQLFSSKWAVLLTSVVGVLVTACIGAFTVHRTFAAGAIFGLADWLFLDALSAFHLAILLLVFSLASLFSIRYFGEELGTGHLSLEQTKTFAGLWAPALGAMSLVLVSNNLGIMWVGMEATTLLTSFLICVHMTRGSLEAMWKYMLICSVGIAFAFLGTLMIRMAAKDLPLDPNQALLWTNLIANTGGLAPGMVKAAFIFVLVGYGTKAGLAPMHTWLPDAHSKAPSPVSAVFSGFMLNTALYCILRYIPIVEGTIGGTGWSLNLLTGFGLFSMLIASAFILHQHDLKRLLAYCSVEHLGIIAIGIGLGGLGTFAALFHTLNHSLCKTLSFFAAGRLGQFFGTYEMDRMAGSCKVSPIWGWAIFLSLLALVGMVPFSLFMSEFQILKAAVDADRIGVIVLFLIATSAVFVAMLKYALPLAWGKPTHRLETVSTNALDTFLVFAPLAILLTLGVWMPHPLRNVLQQAAEVVHHVPNKPATVPRLGAPR